MTDETIEATGGALSPGLWARLWDFDPSAVVVVSPDLTVLGVNAAFCTLVGMPRAELIGQPLGTVLEDADVFRQVWEGARTVDGEIWEDRTRGILAHRRIVALPEHHAIACFAIDQRHLGRNRAEAIAFRREAVRQAREVIDRQMKVAQEIASLLGETTAESKISLLKLVDMVEGESEG